MCDHGPAKHHLEELGKDSKNTLITTGFMSAGSAGKRFISKALDPMSDHTGADVVEMSHYYSAHGDQTKLLDHIFNLEGYTASMRETVIFINHGEDNGKTAFKEAIANRAREIKPNDRRISEIQLANGQWFNLDTGRYEDGPRPEEELKKAMLEKGLSADDVKKLIEHVS